MSNILCISPRRQKSYTWRFDTYDTIPFSSFPKVRYPVQTKAQSTKSRTEIVDVHLPFRYVSIPLPYLLPPPPFEFQFDLYLLVDCLLDALGPTRTRVEF